MYEVRTSARGSSSNVPEPLPSTTRDGGGGLPILALLAVGGTTRVGELPMPVPLMGEGTKALTPAAPHRSAISASTNDGDTSMATGNRLQGCQAK